MKIINFNDTDTKIQMIGYYIGLVSLATLLIHGVLGDGVGLSQYLDWTAEQRVKRAAKLCKAVTSKLSETDAAKNSRYVVEGMALTDEILADIVDAATSGEAYGHTITLKLVSAD